MRGLDRGIPPDENPPPVHASDATRRGSVRTMRCCCCCRPPPQRPRDDPPPPNVTKIFRSTRLLRPASRRGPGARKPRPGATTAPAVVGGPAALRDAHPPTSIEAPRPAPPRARSGPFFFPVHTPFRLGRSPANDLDDAAPTAVARRPTDDDDRRRRSERVCLSTAAFRESRGKPGDFVFGKSEIKCCLPGDGGWG